MDMIPMMKNQHPCLISAIAGLVIPFLGFSLAGCLTTKAIINSTPQGAIVYFDSKRLPEVTPTEVEVDWYGGHKITVMKDGYVTNTSIVQIKPPFYAWMPLDLGATLIPYNIKDKHAYHVELIPEEGTTPPVESGETTQPESGQ